MQARHSRSNNELSTGKYRVGVITALIRRLQCWSMTSIYEEYARFAGHDRVADEEVSVPFSMHLLQHC